MKILMILNTMNIGGAETHVLELASELHRRGHEIHIASSGGTYVAELEKDGIRHFTMPLHSRSVGAVYKSYRALKKLIRDEKYDIVHSHARIPAFLCGIIRKKLDFRYVSTTHGVYEMNAFWRILTDWGEKSLAVSVDIKDYLIREYSVLPENITITINGIDTNKFASEADSSFAESVIGLPSDTVKLVHVSRIDPDASVPAFALVEVAAEVYAAHHEFRLVIVGDGTDFPRLKHLSDAVNDKCGEKVITLVGSQTNISSFMAAADLFAGVSRAALEAMSAAKPVILGGNGGYIGLLTKEKLSLAIDSNFTCRESAAIKHGALRDDIIALLNMSSSERQTLGEFNRQVISEHYSVGRMADDYEAIYSTLTPFKSFRYPEVMINGYYGFGNHGDDALLRMIISLIRERRPDTKITVLSQKPRNARRDYGVNGVFRYNFLKVKRYMKHSRLLISGGGSLLQDATSTKSFFYYSYIMRLARRSGAKLMVYANGLGPLSGKRNIDIARRVLAQANVVTLRDRESLEFFSSLETGSVARLTGDPALCYKPCDSHTARLILHKMGINDKKYFIVALRRGKNSVLVHNVADYCNLMVREKGIYPLFVCMQKRVDHSVVEELKRSCPEGFVLPENISISEMLGVYAASEFVLGMRLHSLIYAAAVRRPMLGIRYDPKVSSFLSCVGYGDFVVGERVTTGELFNKSSVILLDRERRDMLAKTVGELCTLAHADADTAVKLIESK